MIYTTSLFGNEVSMIEVTATKSDYQTDIIGVRECEIKNLKNCIEWFCKEPYLITLAPCDLAKTNSMNELYLPLLLSLQKETDKKIFSYGDVWIDGSLHSSKGLYTALCGAIENGIEIAIIPKENSEPIPTGIKVFYAETVDDAIEIYNKIIKGV